MALIKCKINSKHESTDVLNQIQKEFWKHKVKFKGTYQTTTCHEGTNGQ
jgi:hypothetical protein